MTETAIRQNMTRMAQSLFARGLTFGSSGNLSARLEDGFLVTPTGASLGELEPARLSKLDRDGNHISGDNPTKESVLHLAIYNARPNAKAVVHLHSSNAVAISCLAGLDTENTIPPLTAYFAMRIRKLPLAPYFPPGDPNLAKAVHELALHHHAILMANHGPVVAGKSLADAMTAAEELEETAKLFLKLHGRAMAPLSDEQTAELRARFPVEC